MREREGGREEDGLVSWSVAGARDNWDPMQAFRMIGLRWRQPVGCPKRLCVGVCKANLGRKITHRCICSATQLSEKPEDAIAVSTVHKFKGFEREISM